jgi:N-acetylglutamate synthase-like GNAT family acetyltransferase
LSGALEIVPFRPEFERAVARLILAIQQNEFGIEISAEQQPDLALIPDFYQVGRGNFWVALAGGEVVGTISLLDIGSSQAALRKMFVHLDFRGSCAATASRLLEMAMDWARAESLREIFLGTTAQFVAAHRFYEKNGFSEIAVELLPAAFPVMEVDTKFYHRALAEPSRG